jgi:hypothetical protein
MRLAVSRQSLPHPSRPALTCDASPRSLTDLIRSLFVFFSPPTSWPSVLSVRPSVDWIIAAFPCRTRTRPTATDHRRDRHDTHDTPLQVLRCFFSSLSLPAPPPSRLPVDACLIRLAEPCCPFHYFVLLSSQRGHQLILSSTLRPPADLLLTYFTRLIRPSLIPFVARPAVLPRAHTVHTRCRHPSPRQASNRIKACRLSAATHHAAHLYQAVQSTHHFDHSLQRDQSQHHSSPHHTTASSSRFRI